MKTLQKIDWPKYLRQWRAERGISQRKLGELLSDGERHTATRTVEQWESGQRTPPPFLALALKALR